MSKNNKSKKYIQNTYYVEGMHCASCETLVSSEIEDIDSAYKVDASLKNSKVVIKSSKGIKLPTIEDLNRKFKDLDYTFHSKQTEDKPLTQNEILLVLTVVTLVILFIKWSETSGLFINYSLNGTSSVITYFIFGIIAGLSSCAALVGGLLLSLSKSWIKAYNGNKKHIYKPFIMFNIGRLISYAFLGGILGLVGSIFTVTPSFNAFLIIIVSLLMLFLGLQMLGVKWALAIPIKTPKFISDKLDVSTTLKGKYMPLLIGAATFFIPCGFTLIAQTNALTSSSFTLGAVRMGAFALGTLPTLAVLSFTSVKLYSNKSFSRVFNYIVGAVVILFALYNFNSQLNVLGIPSINAILDPHVSNSEVKSATIQGNYQILNLSAKGFEYFPEKSQIKAVVPTKLVVNNEGVLGCAVAMYANGLHDDVIYLNKGENVVDIGSPKKGTYRISCSMGMVKPIVVKVI